MADNIGIKLGIEGEKEFKKAISDINQDYKILRSELNAVTSQFDKNDKSVRALAAQNEVLNKQIESQKDKIETLRAALKNSAETYGENDSRTKNWQIQLNNAEAQLNKLNRQVEQNKRDMNAAENETEQETAAVKDLGSAADKSGPKLQNLGKTLSTALRAGAAAAAALGAAAVAAGKKIWDMANDVAETGDEIDKMSQKIGISAESYQEWSYVFERCGADVNNLQAGMKTLSTVITDASKGSDTAAKKLAAVGLSVKDLAGKSQDEQLSIVIAALQKMESGSERTAAATRLLGKSATELGAVLNMSAEETAALREEAERYGMVMSDEAVKASAKFEDSLTKLNGTITGVKNKLLGELLPGLTGITDGLSEMFAGIYTGRDKFQKGVNDMVTSLKKVIPQATQILKTVASSVLPGITSLIGEVGSLLIESLPELARELIPTAIDSAQTLLTSLIGQIPELLNVGLTEVLPQLVTGALSVAGTLLSQLTESLPGLMKTLSTTIVDLVKELTTPEKIRQTVDDLLAFISAIGEGLSEAFPILLDGAVTLVTQLAGQLPYIMQQLIAKIPDAIDLLFGDKGLLSSDNINLLINGAVDAALELVKHTPQIVSALLDAIPDIIDGLFSAVDGFLSEDNINDLVDGAVMVTEEVVKNTPKIIKSLIEKIPEICDEIIDKFGGLIDRFLGLGAGCGSEFLKGFVSNAYWILKLLGINSDTSSSIDFNSIAQNIVDTINGNASANAEGGVINHPTLSWIAENGPEVVIPLKNNTEWIDRVAEQFYKMGGAGGAGGVSVSVTFSGDVNMNSDQDIEDVAQKVGEYIAGEVIKTGKVWA